MTMAVVRRRFSQRMKATEVTMPVFGTTAIRSVRALYYVHHTLYPASISSFSRFPSTSCTMATVQVAPGSVNTQTTATMGSAASEGRVNDATALRVNGSRLMESIHATCEYGKAHAYGECVHWFRPLDTHLHNTQAPYGNGNGSASSGRRRQESTPLAY